MRQSTIDAIKKEHAAYPQCRGFPAESPAVIEAAEKRAGGVGQGVATEIFHNPAPHGGILQNLPDRGRFAAIRE